MLQIAQASVNDPRRPARRSRGKIMLLDQKRPFTAPGTLARDSDAVNSATDHNDLKPLTFQRRPSFRIDFHTPTEPLRTENWQLRTGSLPALLPLIYSVYRMSGTGERFERAVSIMARLRGPGGCPWDREQTFDSIKPYTLEETYEVLEAIDNRDWQELTGELGDLLLQVLFYSEIAKEQGTFSIGDVLDRLSTKLVDRHPHVFGNVKAETSSDVLRNWEALKAEEKKKRLEAGGGKAPKPSGSPESVLAAVSPGMPALLEPHKRSSPAAHVGRDWPNIEGLFEKLAEGTSERVTADSLVIRKCYELDEIRACVALQKEVWNFTDLELVPLRMFVVAEKVGGQVIGAFDGKEIVGFALSIPGARGGHSYLHSHMLAVRKRYRNAGLGRRIKLLQREDAIARGFELIEWTFDPLEIKNAYLNIEKLGIITRRYSVNQYGITTSPLQGGLPTDRLVAEWWLKSKRVENLLRNGERHGFQVVQTIHVPARVYEWKANAATRQRAKEIQDRNRSQFLAAFASGLCVLGYERDPEGNGRFLLGKWDENWLYEA